MNSGSPPLDLAFPPDLDYLRLRPRALPSHFSSPPSASSCGASTVPPRIAPSISHARRSLLVCLTKPHWSSCYFPPAPRGIDCPKSSSTLQLATRPQPHCSGALYIPLPYLFRCALDDPALVPIHILRGLFFSFLLLLPLPFFYYFSSLSFPFLSFLLCSFLVLPKGLGDCRLTVFQHSRHLISLGCN